MRTVREDNAGVHKVHCTCIKRGETSPDWASMSVETEDNANSSCACAPGKQGKCFLLLLEQEVICLSLAYFHNLGLQQVKTAVVN